MIRAVIVVLPGHRVIPGPRARACIKKRRVMAKSILGRSNPHN